jgi:Zn-dependent protease
LQSSDFVIAVFKFVVLLLSLSVHECAHAWMASRLGDNTARELGRVSLNPVDHIDPIGTLLFPAIILFGPLVGFTFFSGILIGWAKPTPVLSRNFHRIVRDENLTTLAGPASNLLLVLIAFLVLAVLSFVVPNGHQLVPAAFAAILNGPVELAGPAVLPAVLLLSSLTILINLSLCFFNLLPIPPLDGSHLLRNMLPYNAVQTYDRIPVWVSYLLMMFVGGFILSLLLFPALGIIYFALRLV